MRRPAILAYSLAALVMVLDQLSKWWVVFGLELPAKQHIEISRFFDLSMVWNRGVSFGLFRSPDGQETIRWMLAAFSAAISIALIIWVRKAVRTWTGVAIGLIIGGAIGNLIDRVRWGAVADFIDVSGLGFFPWVFNVADAGINIGVAILLIETFLTPDKPKDKIPA